MMTSARSVAVREIRGTGVVIVGRFNLSRIWNTSWRHHRGSQAWGAMQAKPVAGCLCAVRLRRASCVPTDFGQFIAHGTHGCCTAVAGGATRSRIGLGVTSHEVIYVRSSGTFTYQPGARNKGASGRTSPTASAST